MNKLKINNQLHRSKFFPKESIVIGCIIIAIVIAITGFVGNYYIQRADSRVALQQGKAVLLAMEVISAECYGENRAFTDSEGDFGFADGIQQKIQDLSGCDGEIYLLGWDAKDRKILKFCYIEGDYVATYELNKNQEVQWDVFRIQSKM